ncbi:MAG: site-specific DNA-methyltransferase [Methylococcaceae bacterium]
MEKLNLHSPDFTQANIEKLAELFPNCVTETRAADGALKKAIDFDLLKQELSTALVDGPQERYQLNWPGKREALLTANAPIAKTLRPCREESVDFDSTQNLYIEGDNLDALKLLQETYLGKVKMIYIDPPYNTGNDFIYEDDFAENSEAYFERSNQKDEVGNRLVANNESNGRFHSDWLSMMYPRLKLARNLLRDDGCVFISIDDNEQANLKRLCDEVFGEENFVATFVWQKTLTRRNDAKSVSNAHEYLVAYVKNQNNFRLNRVDPDEKQRATYTNRDNDPRGDWLAIPFHAPNLRPNLTYPIVTPSSRVLMPPAGRCWSTTKEKIEGLIADNRIYFGKDGAGMAQRKKFWSEREEGMVAWTWWRYEEAGENREATKEIKDLFDNNNPFDSPKPTRLIKKILELATHDNESDIILDFFSGSATTAHAVMALNAEDGGQRKFIMVQIPEVCDEKSDAYKTGYKSITEIGKERIRRAGQKIKAENVDKAGIDQLDIGFRVLKIDSSNMKDVYYTPDNLQQGDLIDQIDNIREDRTAEDLLFQVLLDWGVDLTLPITQEIITGKTVLFVDDNTLAACFDTDINEAFVKELAARHPMRVVFRDTCFASDSVKINIEQIFKLISPTTEIKTL